MPKDLQKKSHIVDNSHYQESLEKILIHLGYKYFSAKTDEDAYHALIKETYDVLFFDSHTENKTTIFY
jgi:DNA-binding response OmpR family regulator